MLLEHGADPNKRYFFGAEINLVNDYEALELLLTFGAHTETRDRSGMTPLMRAARLNQVEPSNNIKKTKTMIIFFCSIKGYATSIVVIKLWS